MPPEYESHELTTTTSYQMQLYRTAA